MSKKVAGVFMVLGLMLSLSYVVRAESQSAAPAAASADTKMDAPKAEKKAKKGKKGGKKSGKKAMTAAPKMDDKAAAPAKAQ